VCTGIVAWLPNIDLEEFSEADFTGEHCTSHPGSTARGFDAGGEEAAPGEVVRVVVLFISLELKFGHEQVASKRRNCLASRLLIQSQDIWLRRGQVVKITRPLKTSGRIQVIAYAFKTANFLVTKPTYVRIPCFFVITILFLSLFIIRTLSALSMPFLIVYTFDLYTFYTRCSGFGSCCRFKGILFSRFISHRGFHG